MVDKIIKADPRIYLEELSKSEKEIISKIHELERKLKLQLVELQTTREMMQEAIKDIEDKDVETFEKASENINKNIERLEKVVQEVGVKKKELNVQDDGSPYQLNKDDMKVATSYQTIERLSYLASKSNWSYDEAKEFAGIKYNVTKALDTGFNPIIMNRLENVYKAVGAVEQAKPEVSKYEFKPPSLEEKLDNVKAYTDSSDTKYKPMNVEKPKYETKNDDLSTKTKKLDEL